MKKTKIFSLILLIICCLCFSTVLAACDGCSGESNDESPKFELTDLKIELELGAEYQICIKGGTTETVSYDSEDQNVATVNESGVVEAQAVGTTNINVTIKEDTVSLTVIVYDTGEIPRIVLNNVDDSDVVKVNLNSEYVLDYSLIYKGKELDVAVQLVSANSSVATVNANKITFVSLGLADINLTAVYKSWTVEKVVHFEVVEDVYVYVNTNNVELSTSDVVGQKTCVQIEQPKVFKDKQEVLNANIIWESLNASVATVENGLISAVAVGQTEVRAKYVYNNVEYWTYIDVNVQAPYLKTPESLTFNEKTSVLTWNAVDYADSYIVEADGTQFEVESNSFNADNYFGGTYFTVKAISDNENVKNSEVAVLNFEIKSKNLRNAALVYEYLDANITRDDEFFNEYGTEVFYADCEHAEPFNWNNDATKYGYAFKKVYVISKTAQMGIADWCKTALISNKDAIGKYYGSSISLWVYSQKGVVIRYVSSHVAGDNNTIIAQQTVPADKWTKVSFTISRSDFPLVTFLTASDDFYFTDIRISAFGYISNDYSELPYYVGWDAQKYIDQVNQISTSNIALSDGQLILKARECYNSLSSDKKGQIQGYSDFVERENKYYELVAAPFIDGLNWLPELSNLTLEDRGDVESLRQIYEGFIPAVKDYVSVKAGLNKLVEYENQIKILYFNYVQTCIDNLPSAEQVTVYDEDVILQARYAYEALSEEEKERIDGYQDLLDCERALKVELLIRLIDALPVKEKVLSSDGDYIYTALIEYNNLGSSDKAKISNVQKLNELKECFDTRYPHVRIYGESGMSSSSLDVNHGLDYVRANAEIEIINANSSASNYKNDYVYCGEYGSLFKLKITANGSGVGTNWAVIANFNAVLEKMNEVSAPFVKLYIYNNTAEKEVITFGHFDTVASNAVLRSVNPGWNVVTFTQDEIQTIISLKSFICNDTDAPSEYWISDFFVANYEIEDSGERVFGESLIKNLLSVSSKDHLKADVQATIIGKYDFEKGLGLYSYEGEFGSLYKVSVSKVANNKFGGNWGVKVDFEKALARMVADDAQTATLYIYSNNELNRYLMFGSHWVSGLYGEYEPGWHAFTFTQEQMQSIINAGSLICCDGTSFESGVNSVEYWISDFFIDKPDLELPKEPTSPNQYADGRVFGDKGITSSYVAGKTADHLKASVSVDVIETDSAIIGQGNYVYDGAYGKLAKLTIEKTSGSYGGNWQALIKFSQVKSAMEITGATQVKFHIYSNNSHNLTMHVGGIWESFYYEGVAPGWHEFTYTLSEIETIINEGGCIGSDNAFGTHSTVEFWVSDFFLNI